MHISTLTSTQEKNTDILKWFDLLFFILMKRFVERRLFPQCWTSASLDFSVWVCASVCGGLHVVYSGLFVFLLLPADSLNTEMNRGQWTTLNFLISAPQTNTSCCKSKTKFQIFHAALQCHLCQHSLLKPFLPLNAAQKRNQILLFKKTALKRTEDSLIAECFIFYPSECSSQECADF